MILVILDNLRYFYYLIILVYNNGIMVYNVS